MPVEDWSALDKTFPAVATDGSIVRVCVDFHTQHLRMPDSTVRFLNFSVVKKKSTKYGDVPEWLVTELQKMEVDVLKAVQGSFF